MQAKPATKRIVRCTAAELREEWTILEISARVWVPTTWTMLKGMDSKGSRVLHTSLGEGQVVDIYDTTNLGLKVLGTLSLLHTVSPWRFHLST